MRQRKRSSSSQPAAAPFRRSLERVEEAKGALLAAVPVRRGTGAPLAEALAGFEFALRAARDEMAGWKTPELEEDWVRCMAALDEASKRAELLRLEATPEGYEELYGLLGDALDPLEAFDEAADRLGKWGLA